MAPEQIMGQKDVDWRVDIFALGVTMYYLLAGNHYPFETGEVLYHNVHTKPPELKDRNPLVSDELNRIVMKCMEKDRSMRYQSALELKSDIDALPSPT
jgi:serine/threonine-protein kinase